MEKKLHIATYSHHFQLPISSHSPKNPLNYYIVCTKNLNQCRYVICGLHCHCTKSHFCPLSTVYYGNLDDLYDVNNNKTCPAILKRSWLLYASATLNVYCMRVAILLSAAFISYFYQRLIFIVLCTRYVLLIASAT